MIQKLLFLQKKLSYAVTTFLMDAQKKRKIVHLQRFFSF